ncbi:MAG: ABC-ATPase domain-containing protein [Elusimicrobiota bacterium]
MLKEKLNKIDGRGYKAYKRIKGQYSIKKFTLYVDHVQGDPYAAPSKMRVRLDNKYADFPSWCFKPNIRKIAAQDYVTRKFYSAINKFCKKNRGTGKSGMFLVDNPGQEIIQRTSCVLNKDYVEVRFKMGLPARGRRVLGRQAQIMFFEELPKIVQNSLYFNNLDSEKIKKHIDTNEIQYKLRNSLKEHNLVAFIGEGAILPRKSGISQEPLDKDSAVAFKSPENLKVTIKIENYGAFSGMGIKKGITLIVGGGYHGKSTLLNALSRGIYNHIPDDGREEVVTDSHAFSIRSEDGRYIEKVNISPFIYNLPHLKDTTSFSTENASGSTSQAANIIEGIEAGAKVLLVDEDTSATNFMIRDERMQELIAKEKEPITPFIDKVKTLYNDYGISTILVMGGSGDYFDIADNIIAMDEYLPVDVTSKAKKIAQTHHTRREKEGGEKFGSLSNRIPLPGSIDPSRGKRAVKIKVRKGDSILFGRNEIDLNRIDQITGSSQLRAAANIIVYCLKKGIIDGEKTNSELISIVQDILDQKGLDEVCPFITGDLARPRMLETFAALNRLRTLKCKIT